MFRHFIYRNKSHILSTHIITSLLLQLEVRNDLPFGRVRKIALRTKNNQPCLINAWRGTSTIPLAIGQKIEIWDATCKENSYHNCEVFHLNAKHMLMVNTRIIYFSQHTAQVVQQNPISIHQFCCQNIHISISNLSIFSYSSVLKTLILPTVDIVSFPSFNTKFKTFCYEFKSKILQHSFTPDHMQFILELYFAPNLYW